MGKPTEAANTTAVSDALPFEVVSVTVENLNASPSHPDLPAKIAPFKQRANTKASQQQPVADRSSEEKQTPNDTAWVTVPDLHGNAKLMIYRLMACGVLKDETINIKTENGVKRTTRYERLAQIYEQTQDIQAKSKKLGAYTSIAKKNIEELIAEFKTLLNSLEITNKDLAIRFLGDMLADRGANDYLTLLVLDHLKKNGIQYEIIFSNHDALFIEALEKNKLKTIRKCRQYVKEPTQSQSLQYLEAIINEGIVDEVEVKKLAKNSYTPQLKLFSYDVAGHNFTFYTHAPVDFEVIKDAAIALQVEYKDETLEEFCQTIDSINAAFSRMVDCGKLNVQLDKEMEAARALLANVAAKRKHQLAIVGKAWDKLALQYPTLSALQDITYGDLIEKIAENEYYKTESESDVYKNLKEAYKKYEEIAVQMENVGSTGYHRCHFKEAPLYTSIWSRIKTVSGQPSDEKHTYGKFTYVTRYTWPETGWKATATNVHGHTSGIQVETATGTTVTATDTTRSEELPPASPQNESSRTPATLSPHYVGMDNSDLGKLDTQNGQMIQQLSVNTRMSANPMSVEHLKEGIKAGQEDFRHINMMVDDYKIPLTLTHQHVGENKQEAIQHFFQKHHLVDVKLSQSIFDFLYECGVKNFAGADLSGLNLSNKNFSIYNNVKNKPRAYSTYDFTGAKLNGADLEGADLRGAIFAKTELRNAKLENICINIHTDFRKCEAKNNDQSAFRDDLKIRFESPEEPATTHDKGYIAPIICTTKIDNLLENLKSKWRDQHTKNLSLFEKPNYKNTLESAYPDSNAAQLFMAMHDAHLQEEKSQLRQDFNMALEDIKKKQEKTSASHVTPGAK